MFNCPVQKLRQIGMERLEKSGELRILGVTPAQAAQDFGRRLVEGAQVLMPAGDGGRVRGVTPASRPSCFTV